MLADMLHQHHHAFDASDQIHRAAHALDHLAGDHPVGKVALTGHLHGTEDGEIDVTAADHREAVLAAEIAGTGTRRHRLLASIDQVGIDFIFRREGADSKQAVLGLQPHIHAIGNVVGHQRWQANTEIDVGAVVEFLGRTFGHLVAIPGHFNALPG